MIIQALGLALRRDAGAGDALPERRPRSGTSASAAPRVQAHNWRLMALGSLVLVADPGGDPAVAADDRLATVPTSSRSTHGGGARAWDRRPRPTSRATRRSPSTSRASSTTCARCRSIPWSCARTGSRPTTSSRTEPRVTLNEYARDNDPSPRSAARPSRSR